MCLAQAAGHKGGGGGDMQRVKHLKREGYKGVCECEREALDFNSVSYKKGMEAFFHRRTFHCKRECHHHFLFIYFCHNSPQEQRSLQSVLV